MKKAKSALITGITGQDGSYLSEFLIEKGYTVHGIVRSSTKINSGRIDHIIANKDLKDRFFLHDGDLSDSLSLFRLIQKIQPDEIYNLASQSHVRQSFEMPEYTGDTTGLGVVRMLEAIRSLGAKTKYYQAGSSEMYGKVQQIPQTEATPFYPRSPYGVAKLYAHWMCVNYREAYNMFICNGILFNHESPRRGENFVTRKISMAAAEIKLGLRKDLQLGNIDAKRDWGHAKDYAEGMWMMLQQDVPQDFVLATGITHSVRDFCEIAFAHVGLNYKDYVSVDEKNFRPTDIELVVGDATKAKKILGWQPRTSFKELVVEMVDADLKMLQEKK